MHLFRFTIFAILLYLLAVSCQEGTGGESCSDGILGDTEYTIDCGGSCPLCLEFFQSSWVSEGNNIAKVWKELFSAQKITAAFYEDNSYDMAIENTDGFVIPMEGTYSLADSGIDGIWTIILNQDKPDSKVFKGIVKANSNYIINVEVVQTEPYLGAVAPTPEGGLGSTKTETDGKTVALPGNVQKYIRQ